jgi:hypothetical protein
MNKQFGKVLPELKSNTPSGKSVFKVPLCANRRHYRTNVRGLPMSNDDWLTLPDLENKPKYIRWSLMVLTWGCWAIVVFGHGSTLASDITELFFVLFGFFGIGFFLAAGLSVIEWIVRSVLHWQTNTHVAGTPWMPSEIENKLFFMPFLKISCSWFLMSMLLGFAVAASAAIIYLISSGHFGFMSNFGSRVAHM